MAKPAITKRTVKNAALTYQELDDNFQNIVDSTLSLTGDSGGTAVTADLNGNITLVAGTGVTITGDNTAKTITINGSGGLTLNTTTDTTTYPIFATSLTTGSTTNAVIDAGIQYNATSNELTVTGAVNAGSVITDQLIGDQYASVGNTYTLQARSSGNGQFQFVLSGATSNSNEFNWINTPNGSDIALKAGEVGDPGPAIELFGNSSLNGFGNPYDINIRSPQTGAIRFIGRTKLPTGSSALSNPENGMIFYNTSTNKFQGYANGTWVDLH